MTEKNKSICTYEYFIENIYKPNEDKIFNVRNDVEIDYNEMDKYIDYLPEESGMRKYINTLKSQLRLIKVDEFVDSFKSMLKRFVNETSSAKYIIYIPRTATLSNLNASFTNKSNFWLLMIMTYLILNNNELSSLKNDIKYIYFGIGASTIKNFNIEGYEALYLDDASYSGSQLSQVVVEIPQKIIQILIPFISNTSLVKLSKLENYKRTIKTWGNEEFERLNDFDFYKNLEKHIVRVPSKYVQKSPAFITAKDFLKANKTQVPVIFEHKIASNLSAPLFLMHHAHPWISLYSKDDIQGIINSHSQVDNNNLAYYIIDNILFNTEEELIPLKNKFIKQFYKYGNERYKSLFNKFINNYDKRQQLKLPIVRLLNIDNEKVNKTIDRIKQYMLLSLLFEKNVQPIEVNKKPEKVFNFLKNCSNNIEVVPTFDYYSKEQNEHDFKENNEGVGNSRIDKCFKAIYKQIDYTVDVEKLHEHSIRLFPQKDNFIGSKISNTALICLLGFCIKYKLLIVFAIVFIIIFIIFITRRNPITSQREVI